MAGIVAHLVCGVRPPFPALQEAFADTRQVKTILIMLACGALFGLIALLLIESLRFFERTLRRFERRPYLLAAAGGVALVLLYLAAGDTYAGLGTDTINGVLAGTTPVFAGAFLLKILATSITLETGGSGGIVTPIFFVGATSGAALAPFFGVPTTFLAAVGLVAMLAAAANTPIAAAVMAMELLPGPEGVYAALAAATAFLMVGHRSVYASQKIGLVQVGRPRRGAGRGHRRRHSRIRPYPQGQSDRARTPVRPCAEFRQENGTRRFRVTWPASTLQTPGFSNTRLSRARSFRLARRMAYAMKGATHAENPVGVPRFRRVIRVRPGATGCQV